MLTLRLLVALVAIVLSVSATPTERNNNAVKLYPISKEQYESLLRLTDGKPEISEGRFLQMAAFKGLGSWIPSFNTNNSTVEKGDRLCVIGGSFDINGDYNYDNNGLRKRSANFDFDLNPFDALRGEGKTFKSFKKDNNQTINCVLVVRQNYTNWYDRDYWYDPNRRRSVVRFTPVSLVNNDKEEDINSKTNDNNNNDSAAPQISRYPTNPAIPPYPPNPWYPPYYAQPPSNYNPNYPAPWGYPYYQGNNNAYPQYPPYGGYPSYPTYPPPPYPNYYNPVPYLQSNEATTQTWESPTSSQENEHKHTRTKYRPQTTTNPAYAPYPNYAQYSPPTHIKKKRDQIPYVGAHNMETTQNSYQPSLYPQQSYSSNYPKKSYTHAASQLAPIYVMAPPKSKPSSTQQQLLMEQEPEQTPNEQKETYQQPQYVPSVPFYPYFLNALRPDPNPIEQSDVYNSEEVDNSSEYLTARKN